MSKLNINKSTVIKMLIILKPNNREEWAYLFGVFVIQYFKSNATFAH